MRERHKKTMNEYINQRSKILRPQKRRRDRSGNTEGYTLEQEGDISSPEKRLKGAMGEN